MDLLCKVISRFLREPPFTAGDEANAEGDPGRQASPPS